MRQPLRCAKNAHQIRMLVPLARNWRSGGEFVSLSLSLCLVGLLVFKVANCDHSLCVIGKIFLASWKRLKLNHVGKPWRTSSAIAWAIVNALIDWSPTIGVRVQGIGLPTKANRFCAILVSANPWCDVEQVGHARKKARERMNCQ